MFGIKYICLIIFIIINVLFTIGYATQPILTTAQNSIIPSNGVNSKKPKDVIKNAFYINKMSKIITNIKSTYSTDTNYTNVNNDIDLLFKTILIICIIITIFLAIGILLGFFGLKFISKILFLLTMIAMICIFIVIQFVVVTDSFINNYSENGGVYTAPNVSNGSGYYLTLISVIAMIINYFLYAFLG
jgi:hypothetical protein